MNTNNLHLHRIALAAVMLAGSTGWLRASSDTDKEIQALRAEIQQLDQRLHELEQKQEREQKQQEENTAAAKTAPKVSITEKGFNLASADSDNSVSIRGLIQVDSRLFFGDGGGVLNNTFILRRARPIIEGTFEKIFSFQFVPDFGGTSAPVIQDANLGVAVSPAVQFKFGKFKTPVGMELLQSDPTLFFDERSLVTNLVPNRDLGLQVGGSLAGSTVNYSAGVFNGVPDAANTSNADFDNDKDVVGRLMLQPFKTTDVAPLKGLTFGAAASLGREKGASAVTGGYKTDGQQTFFKYRSTVVGDGQIWRVSPQADYRWGPFGAMGEYVLSTVNLRPTATGMKTELRNKAWQLSAAYVLTGEDSSSAGVVPHKAFNWQDKTWGAWEVALRCAQLRVDDMAFPTFADPATNANRATAVGVGLSWYLSRTVRTTFDYYQTRFDNKVVKSSTQILRQDEQALITRFQISF